MSAFPFARERELFPILRHKVQLSSCSQSALSTPVAQALAAYQQGWLEQGMDWGGWMAGVEQAKAEFARLIGASPEEIATLSSVSDIASSVVGALDFPAQRPRIVATALDFPSTGHVWLAQQRRGAQVHFVDADADGAIDEDTLLAAIDERTRLVALSQVSYHGGHLIDVARVARRAREVGALLFVDAYQSAGTLPIDVERDGIDMLASGAQKYLLGCPGIAFAYVRRGLWQALEPFNTGWFGRANPFAFDIRGLDWAKGARRLDTGTPPMVNACVAAAGMALVNTLDMVAVRDHLRGLSRVALETVREQGLATASPADPARKGSNTAVRVADAAAMERRMAEAGYIVSARGDVVRVAPHFYNTADEVRDAIRTLARLARA
jgi:selenocysteine lyase/cysteine desulfurase